MVLIGINAVVWLVILATGGGRQPAGRHAGAAARRPVRGAAARRLLPGHPRGGLQRQRHLAVPASPTAPTGSWSPAMFTHVEIWHIGFNMLALWVLGPQLERRRPGPVPRALPPLRRSPARPLVLLARRESSASTLGASGAIFGLMGALLVLASRSRQRPGHPDAGSASTSSSPSSAAAISWQGHLGGFLGGARDRRGPRLRPAAAAYAVAGARPGRRSPSRWSCAIVAARLVLALTDSSPATVLHSCGLTCGELHRVVLHRLCPHAVQTMTLTRPISSGRVTVEAVTGAATPSGWRR